MTEHFIIFFGYFLVIILISLYASKFTHNLSDYVLGARHLSAPITALGVGASDMSGWLLLGLPGALYLHGLSCIWMVFGLIIGAYLNWLLFSKRLRIYSEVAGNAMTLPAYLENRFEDTTGSLRLFSGLVILIFFLFYTASGFVGGAVLFESIFHFSYSNSLYFFGLFIILYTSIGGFLAISWVDFFQGSLMFFALILVPFLTYIHLTNHDTSFHLFNTLSRGYINPFSSTSHIVGMISSLAWSIGYFGQPHILVRFMAIRAPHELVQARRLSMGWMIITLMGAIGTGLLGQAFFIHTHHALINPETVFLHLSEELFNSWISGILLSAVLSAIMSTISAQLLAASSSIVEDIYHRFIYPQASTRHLLLWSRLSVLVLGAIAVTLAFNSHGTILSMVSYAWAGLGASFGPAILLSLFWKRMTLPAAVLGIFSAAVTTVAWKWFVRPLGGWLNIYEIVPGFLSGLIIILTVSLISTPPSQQIQNTFEKVRRLARKCH